MNAIAIVPNLRALSLATLICVTPALAEELIGQSPTWITGAVKSPDGTPIAGYPVIIATEDQSSNVVVFTGQDGAYSLKGLATGNYVAIAGTQLKEPVEFAIPQVRERAEIKFWPLFSQKQAPVAPNDWTRIEVPALMIAPGMVAQ